MEKIIWFLVDTICGYVLVACSSTASLILAGAYVSHAHVMINREPVRAP